MSWQDVKNNDSKKEPCSGSLVKREHAAFPGTNNSRLSSVHDTTPVFRFFAIRRLYEYTPENNPLDSLLLVMTNQLLKVSETHDSSCEEFEFQFWIEILKNNTKISRNSQLDHSKSLQNVCVVVWAYYVSKKGLLQVKAHTVWRRRLQSTDRFYRFTWVELYIK